MTEFVYFIVGAVVGFIVGALVFKNNEATITSDIAKVKEVENKAKTIVEDVEKNIKKL